MAEEKSPGINESCGLTGKQKEIFDNLMNLDTAQGVIGLAAAVIPGFPTTGQGVAKALGAEAEYLKLITEIERIESFIDDPIGGILNEVDFPPEVDSLQSDIRQFIDEVKPIVSDARAVVLTAKEIENKVQNLKNKWSGVDVDLDNIAQVVQSAVVDIDNLCKTIGNWKRNGEGDLVLYGSPITVPTTGPLKFLTGKNIPRVIVPEIRIDLDSKAEELVEEYQDISKPFFGISI